MLVTTVANVIYILLNALFVFNLPQFPSSVVTIFNEAVGYLGAGLDMLHLLIGNTAFTVLGVTLGLVVSANAVYFVVSLVFFVLKKIPFLGLKE